MLEFQVLNTVPTNEHFCAALRGDPHGLIILDRFLKKAQRTPRLKMDLSPDFRQTCPATLSRILSGSPLSETPVSRFQVKEPDPLPK